MFNFSKWTCWTEQKLHERYIEELSLNSNTLFFHDKLLNRKNHDKNVEKVACGVKLI